VNDITGALTRPGQLGHAASGYLRDAISAGTRDVYLGLAGVTVVTSVTVLIIIPRRFTTREGLGSVG
jgi:hypothetical protein